MTTGAVVVPLPERPTSDRWGRSRLYEGLSQQLLKRRRCRLACAAVGAFQDLFDEFDADHRVSGEEFEQICQWFLINDPVHRHGLRRARAEMSGVAAGQVGGFDLVAEDRSGRLWAIKPRRTHPATGPASVAWIRYWRNHVQCDRPRGSQGKCEICVATVGSKLATLVVTPSQQTTIDLVCVDGTRCRGSPGARPNGRRNG